MNGVIYFNRGLGCLMRILVSIHSLRKYYHGRISVLNEEESYPDWFRFCLANMGADNIRIDKGTRQILVAKSSIWKHTPFDHVMFLDADTLVRAPVDDFLNLVQTHGAVFTNFNGWGTKRGRVARRIQEWEKVDPQLTAAARRYGLAINTGVMGWSKGNPIMPEYEAYTLKGFKSGCRRKVLDEIAVQLLVTKYPHHTAGAEWNTGGLHGNGQVAKIIHYHGNKHCRPSENCALWKQEFWDLVRDFPQFEKQWIEKTGDRTIDKWLRESFARRRDMTIVSAVSPEYAESAARNVELWMKTPGLREQRFIFFVHGFKNKSQRSFLDRPNIKVIRWEYPFPDASRRETMLAAFVLGVSDHVGTQYWMKLDCDTKPVRPWWEWPAFEKHTITSHTWGYTKMKGERGATEHWFNRLDRIFSPNKPFFKRTFDPGRDWKVSHRRGTEGIPMRFGSFAHIENTEFTRRIASVVRQRCGGRLPIPSQDTLAWYCAHLWGEAVQLVNQKLWFSPRG